jgi:predicted Zn-dependent protease
MIRNNQLALARSALDKLVKLDPANPRFHYLLSRVLFKLNLPQDAQREAELSRELEAPGRATSPR